MFLPIFALSFKRDELEPSKVGVNCYEDSRPQSQGLGMISVDPCPTSTRGGAWAVRSPVASHERSRTSEYRLYQLCEYRHYAAFQVHRQVRCKHGFSMHGAVSVPYFLERPLSKIPATPMLSNLGSPYRDATPGELSCFQLLPSASNVLGLPKSC